jgi:polyphosphate kinase
VSTGNLNEKTARIYGDHCLLTSNKKIMADINRIFHFLEKPSERFDQLKQCEILIPSPTNMRSFFESLIQKEIRHAKQGKHAAITLKLNSLSDITMIELLNKAAMEGVHIRLIIRSICCMFTENKKFVTPVKAISIVDQFLEHARVFVFHHGGEEKVFISSADWMVRNLDHRVECATPILDPKLKKELMDILNIQLNDQVKARTLDNKQQNHYSGKKLSQKHRSQLETYQYLNSQLV